MYKRQILFWLIIHFHLQELYHSHNISRSYIFVNTVLPFGILIPNYIQMGLQCFFRAFVHYFKINTHMRVTFRHKKIEIFSISKCIYCPLSRINTAFLVVSFYDFNTSVNSCNSSCSAYNLMKLLTVIPPWVCSSDLNL